ncbi:MAG: amidase [Gemmatimonas sp.]|nr:amidase [Gemmatimonas sp.]
MLNHMLAVILFLQPARSPLAETAELRLETASIPEIGEALDAGALTSVTLVELYLDRIHAYDDQGPAINSIISLNPRALKIAAELDRERAAAGSRGPLHGIPILLKDNFDTVDLPTTAGSIALAGSIPGRDATLVERLRAAGAIILGKTNMSEFATPAGRGSYSSLNGVTRNPYDLRRDPSGSSGGTGAAIAANFATIGFGTDTGGSVRGPAAANGLVGLRPTYGLISRHGVIPQALSLDTPGPLARTVTDVAVVLGIVAGPDPNDEVTMSSGVAPHRDYTAFLHADALRGVRIGVARDYFGGDSEVDSLALAAVQAMEGLGATIVDDLVFDDAFHALQRGLRRHVNAEFKPQIEAYLAGLDEGYPRSLAELISIYESREVRDSPNPVNPGLIETHKRNLEIGGLDNPDYLEAIREGLPRARAELTRLFDEYDLDALVYPTSRCPAQPLFDVSDIEFECAPGPSGATLASYSGFPDIQVPMGYTRSGLPTTISLVGRWFSEATLLGYAYTFEQATRHRRPSPLTPHLPGETVQWRSR